MRTGPRHAAPKKPLFTRFHVPAGKAIALAAMPTAVLMGMGFTSTLALADEQPTSKSLTADEYKDCVTALEGASASPSPSASASDDDKDKDSSDSGDEGSDSDKGDTAEPTPSPTDGAGGSGDPSSDSGSDDEAKPKPTPSTGDSAGGSAGGDTATPSPTPSEGGGNLLEDIGDAITGIFTGGTSSDTASPTPSATPSASPSPDSGDADSADKAADSASDTVKETTEKLTGTVDDTVKDTTDKASEAAKDTTEAVEKAAEGVADKATASPSPSPSASTDPDDCPVATDAVGDVDNTQLVADKPWTLKASSLLLKGADYQGVVEVRTASGETKKVLKYVISDGTDIGDLHQIVSENGRTYHVQAGKGTTSTIRDGKTTMYTESISGNLLGLIPITFSPEHPPPLNIPLIYFTNVTVTQAAQFGGTLHVPGMRQFSE
ncbi:hypothetical protein SLINC_5813 [Streptomyces lincolnensis]|uniref:Uncharacterized protein n=1 Tax=Streptomyces lincolnensis TaxID=1915 RepID=A0A1B1MHN3_STRLN|nr:hypothetical protein SLINC_5813 [Streptomyces lincolnensis]AXG53757.1 hypothetical protein SLCG_2602 [Streptomyces lincolnensis]